MQALQAMTYRRTRKYNAARLEAMRRGKWPRVAFSEGIGLTMQKLRKIKRRHDARTLHRWRFLSDLRAEMGGWHYLDDEPARARLRCHVDGMDPWSHYLLPCPVCSDDD